MQEFFPRQISALGAVFAALEEFARQNGLDSATTRDLGVVAEELFTNQVRHARPGTGRIQLSFGMRDGKVQLEVRDRDVEPFDPTAMPEVDITRPAAEREPGGLGVHLVRSLSEDFEWEYDQARRESRIRVTLRLKR